MNTTLRIDTASGAEAATQTPTITSATTKAEQSTKAAITEDALMKLFFTCEAALLKALEYARQNKLFSLLVSTFCIIASVDRRQRCGRIAFSAARPPEGLAPILVGSPRLSQLTLFPVSLLAANFSEPQAAEYLESAVKPSVSFQGIACEQITV